MAALLDIVKKGSTDRSVAIRIVDSTDGTPETGVVYNTSGIDLWYRREGAAKTSITEATLAALTTAHSDGGFLHVGDGEYRLDLPDAAVATGANYVDIGGTVTGMVVIGGRIRLVDVDLEDSTRAGLTALPNAAADAAGGLPISDAGGLDIDAQFAKLGTVTDLGGGATLAANMSDIAGATFDTSTDSNEAIRNRGDAAWLTATGFSTHTAANVRTEMDSNSTQLAKLGTVTDLGGGSTLAANLSDIAGATFDTSTDSNEAIRNRGDAAWTTGSGGSPPELLQNTTIATLASQTSFTLTAGSADDDAYNGHLAIVTDQSTSTQKCVGIISDYVGSSKTVTLDADPAVFTMAAGDTIDIVAVNTAASAPTVTQIRAEMDANSTQLAAIVADTNELQTNQGNWVTATGFSTHSAADVRTEMDANSTQLAAIVADTNELQTNQGNWATATGFSTHSAADVVTAMDGTSTQLAAIVADTNELQTDDVPGLIAALNDVSVSDILTTQMTEAYAANGSAPTLAQAMFAVHQMLMQFAISGTSYTVKKLDNSTTAFVVTLDDGTSPTSAVRT